MGNCIIIVTQQRPVVKSYQNELQYPEVTCLTLTPREHNVT